MARRLLAGWGASIQALGGAFAELVRAELEALGDDLAKGGRRLGGALLLLAVALFVGFWSIGLTLYLAVELAGRWLPRWGAVATVLGVALLLAALLAGIGWYRLRRLEGPSAMIERRWASHRRWWQQQFPPPVAAESRARRAPPDDAGGGEPDGA